MENNVNSIVIEAKIENLSAVFGTFDTKMKLAGASNEQIERFEVAIEEIFTNIVNYSYPNGLGNVMIKSDILQDPLRIEVEMKDDGIPFDPTAKQDPDVTLPLEERGIGGLGIYMAKKLTDEMSYCYDQGNILKLVSKIG